MPQGHTVSDRSGGRLGHAVAAGHVTAVRAGWFPATESGYAHRPAPRNDQEQTQIIINVIGRPIPSAPPIINANADSTFTSACTSRPDMPLLHGALGRRPSPNDEQLKK